MYFALHVLWALDARYVLPILIDRVEFSTTRFILIWLAGCLVIELLSRDRKVEVLPEWMEDSNRYTQLDDATER